MFNFLKFFKKSQKREPGTIMEPMTKEEATAFWIRFHEQADQQSRGW